MRFKPAATGRWITASTLLVLSFVAAPVMAQSSQCNSNGYQVNPRIQNVQEYNAAASYAPTVVTLGTNKALASGMELEWSQLTGTAVTLNLSNPVAPTFTTFDVPAAGATLTFGLRARCPGGAWSSQDTGTVTIINTNRPPYASAQATPALVYPGDAVQLTSTGSYDPDGDTLSYLWEQVNGPAVTLSGATAAAASFTAANTGSAYTQEFRLTVRDRATGGLTHTAIVSVNVSALALPPIARLSCPEARDEGQSVLLDGRTSTANGNGSLSYAWTQYQGSPRVAVGDETGSTVTFTAPHLTTGQDGFLEFHLRVTNSHGLSDLATCTVQVRDVTPPAIQVPAPIVAEATSAHGASVSYNASVRDAVDDADWNPLDCSPASGTTFALAPAPARRNTTAVACSARDTAGNAATAGFDVTVQDTTPPEITVPGSYAVEATSAAGAMAEFEATTADLVDGAGIANCAPASGSQFALGTTPVECGAVDARGNAAAARSFSLTVHDTTAPVVTPPADVTEEATGPLTDVDYGTASATDAVGVVSINSDAPDAFPVGDTVITWTARDAARNAGYATSRVTVTDTTPPVVTVPGDINDVEATSAAGAVVAFTATASDLVDGSVTPTCSPASGTTFGLGTTRVNCSATDRANNAGSAAFSVTVVDTTAPRVSAPADVTAEATGPRTVVAHGVATDSDAVGVVSRSNNAPANFPLGTTTITWTACDAAGNCGTATSRVTVIDTTAPAWNPQLDAAPTVIATGNSQAVVHFNKPTATDLVYGNAEVSCSHEPGSVFPVGATVVSCTASDGHSPTPNISPEMQIVIRVNYGWAGFQRPVDNLPTVNVVKAGSAVPVKFTLAGDQGMAILQQGSPSSGPISCTAAQEDVIAATETLTASNSSLTWDATAGHYVYVWKTEKAWSGCRALSLRFVDGSTRSVMFRFTK